jgi:hypothetical protein
MDPIAFVVMPFGKKKTGATQEGVPTEVDFDRLWDRVYRLVLLDMGYKPVRADQDVGALIISEMLQRLALADLVVADVSLPNANVYYEVGVRHAARRVGCVLIAADWADPVFDLRQIRQLRFPLADGAVEEGAAESARITLKAKLGELTNGTSPVFEAVPGFPDDVDVSHVSTFQEFVAQLSDFDADVRAARLAPQAERRAKALGVVERHGHKKVVRETVVIELVELLRDLVGMEAMLDYINTLPEHIARYPLIVEQKCLALGKTGDSLRAATQLEQLIKNQGPTPERQGLLGGRYKELQRAATTPADQRRYLDLAIASYRRGMLLDLNQYYCASNLPRLYRTRKKDGDDQLASEAEDVAAMACRRGIELGVADEWARSTLLTLAFDAGDVSKAQELRSEVIREGVIAWQLTSTMGDLRVSVESQSNEAVRRQLMELLSELHQLLAVSSGPEVTKEG